jgi:hypothetical protein
MGILELFDKAGLLLDKVSSIIDKTNDNSNDESSLKKINILMFYNSAIITPIGETSYSKVHPHFDSEYFRTLRKTIRKKFDREHDEDCDSSVSSVSDSDCEDGEEIKYVKKEYAITLTIAVKNHYEKSRHFEKFVKRVSKNMEGVIDHLEIVKFNDLNMYTKLTGVYTYYYLSNDDAAKLNIDMGKFFYTLENGNITGINDNNRQNIEVLNQISGFSSLMSLVNKDMGSGDTTMLTNLIKNFLVSENIDNNKLQKFESFFIFELIINGNLLTSSS